MSATRSPELPPELGLAPEVAWYLRDRGFAWPTCPPLIATPGPQTAPSARFDPDRVDKVINVFRALRHTQGPLAGQPLEPDPWQVAYILAPIFGWVRKNAAGDYVRIVREAWVEMPRKGGKGLYAGEVILTGTGWKKFGDLVVGDLVHAEDGTLVPVTYVSPIHELDCYRVTFADGQTVTCDADHQWTVFDRWVYGGRDHSVTDRRSYISGAWKTLSTPEIAITFNVSKPGATNIVDGKAYPRREFRYAVRADRVIERPVTELPIDPYLLGCWLGDGATAAARISTADPEILEAFQQLGYQTPYVAAYDYGIKPGFLVALRALGVLNNKHVPDAYLLASAEQRMELLRGLMDTDGSATVRANARTTRVEFSSCLPALSEAVLFLARSLGWRATMAKHRSQFNGKDYKPRYRVAWTATRERSPFRLARKTARLHEANPAAQARSSTIKIVNVERVPTVPTMCIQVDHPSHQFLVGEGLIPTHNTSLAGGIAIYLTAADGEAGAQVIAAATTREQAGFCFRPIKQLAEQSPLLKKHVTAYANKIVHRKSGSTFQSIASVADAQHGANIAGAIIDEVHLHKDAELIEAIETGTGSRSQPLIFMITTADDGRPNTIYSRKRHRVEQLAEGVLKDPSTYGVIWAAALSEPELHDPFSVAAARRANPGYGISPTAEYLERAAAKAKENPAELGTFLRLHLGVRTRQTTRFIPLAAWDASAGMIDEATLIGRECYGGLDLSSVDDLSAVCWLFPDRDHDRYDAIWRFWVPEDRLTSLSRRTAGAASAWVRQGWLDTTPGNVIDNDAIVAVIDEDARTFAVQTLGYDRWGATDVVRRLGEAGMTCVGTGQGYASLSAPTKELLRLVLRGALTHGGNPVARWMIDNLSVTSDPSGQVKPDKAKAADKIDGVSAAVTALAEAMAAGGDVDILDAVY